MLFRSSRIDRSIEAEAFLALTKEELYQTALRVTRLSQISPKLKDIPQKEFDSLLQVRGISFNYIRGRPVLGNVSFRIGKGSVICLTGHNGCGKTTLGKCICGLLPMQSGEIILDGQILKGSALEENAMFVMQEAEFQFFTNSVVGEIQYGLNPGRDLALVNEMLKIMGLWDVRYRHPFSLSGGQMQKLTLLIAFFSDRQIVVLDEPTSGLDRKSLEAVVKLIDRMKDEKIVILISHDKEFINETGAVCISIEENQESCSLKESREERGKVHLDPRVNLVAVVLTFWVTGMGDRGITIAFSAALVILALFNGQYKVGTVSAGILGGLYGAGYFYPSPATLFLSEFLPRYILIFVTLTIILAGEGATSLIAGLRKIHVPEKAIMIMAVAFRFFPVLRNDFVLMIQSVKSRGIKKGKGKVEKAVESVEAVMISMIFRVIRIAECLAASAETRGIALSRKRDSYIALKMGPRDWFMIIVFGISIGAGFLLH